MSHEPPHPPNQSHPPHHAHEAKDRPRARATIVTVSDTRTLADDEGGALAADLVKSAGHEVVRRVIVKDDVEAIRAAVRAACDEGHDLVITTGGTGIAPRDVTYEAIEALLDKRLDGFGEAFRAKSWGQVGARAILSRALAGTAGRALVVALPGSPKAVRLALEEVLLPLVPHALGLLRG
jgi:molybdenum cofactor biosynthesis protein B